MTANPTAAGDLEARIRRGLAQVIDPEVGVNIVDLGLVYRLQITGDRAEVVMTMTSAACPLGDSSRARRGRGSPSRA